MALERKPQNLRGYGLAQDPTKESDYTFVADQNRRNAQDKGIGAREAAQKKNLAQRDKEARLALLKGIPTLETNWSPEIKNKINTEIEGFVGSAHGLSNEQIIVGLNGLNSKANAYKSIGTALKTRATEVATGKTFAGEGGENLLGLGYEEDFASMDSDEAMAAASGITGSQFAPIPNATDWDNALKRRDEIAKQGTPTLDRTGTMMYGKEIVNENFAVDPALNEATLGNWANTNSAYFRLNPSALQGYGEQLSENVKGKSFQDTPRAGLYNSSSASYGSGGGSNDTHSFSVTDDNVKVDRIAQGITVDKEKNWKTVDIYTTDPLKTLKPKPVKDLEGNNITATVTGVTNKNDKLEIITNRKANPTEMYKRVADAVVGFDKLEGADREKAYIEAIEDESLNISNEITESFDYERNKHLVTASKMDIYKMLGDVRAYNTPEEIKEDGFTYFAKEDGDDPIGIDRLHKSFLAEKRKGDTFGEYIKKFDYFPQEGDMPNVDAANVKKGNNKEKSNTYGI